MNPLATQLTAAVARADLANRHGRLTAFNGLVIESSGPDAHLGELCEVIPAQGRQPVQAEVVGFRNNRVLLMPYGNVQGISADSLVRATGRSLSIPVGDGMLGRVVDAFSAPLDQGPPISYDARYPLYREPLNPLDRAEIDQILETGVRAIDALLTMGVGQRVGVFAGSGVGKSTLLGMLAKQVRADVTVLCLVGERGREVGDFLRNSLGEQGLKRSVVMVATADQPALVRTHAVHAAHAVAEYFRDQGKSVLLILDSMTRFAMAQREIGLAVGEPPTFRGYTPSVFGQLPKLLERCGRVRGSGAISAIYSVLVEGDDMNEPVTDHMRAILDGHIILQRDLAARGHHPAIDPLHSASRLMSQLVPAAEMEVVAEVKRQLATYAGSRDLIELGAHQRGANASLDRAVDLKPGLDKVLCQAASDNSSRAEAIARLRNALASTGAPA
ncbi:MAG TPA: FliI/YscN family ATPase [Arenimonas sp.]|uniref:FliI/YscN family ATPase n=1 Tax=Arenimonas sp. TaxID=1872635 RepID=UPI002D7F2AC4|nr:FliI/YscN family ATPase [Arenimonas sp.]HEU0153483.1 FliI/YscN family ATPase [Arenimonas sp.]